MSATIRSHHDASRRPARRRYTRRLALIGVGALALTACGSDDADESAGTATETETESAAETESVPEAETVIDELVVAEGTAVRVVTSEGEPAPDGSVPTESRSTYEGDLIGEVEIVGSYVVDGYTVTATDRSEFTGELVGYGTGTFTSESTATLDATDETGEATSTIISGTGVFADLVGTGSFSLERFGEEYTYRIEFTPAEQADG